MANHAAKVIDLQDLQEKFHINVKIVGNMQTTNPAIFPFRDPSLCDNIKGHPGSIADVFPMCAACHKLVMTDQPLSCPACLGKHRGHSERKGWCQHTRCACAHPDIKR